MFCTHCGKEIAENAVICPGCGCPTDNFYLAPMPAAKRLNGVAIAALVASILGMILGIYYLIVPAIGLILSVIALVYAKKRNAGRGMAVASLVISILSMVAWVVVFIVAYSLIYGVIMLLILPYAA